MLQQTKVRYVQVRLWILLRCFSLKIIRSNDEQHVRLVYLHSGVGTRNKRSSVMMKVILLSVRCIHGDCGATSLFQVATAHLRLYRVIQSSLLWA